MNEWFKLNTALIQARLDEEHRKHSYIQVGLEISKSYTARMLCEGVVPSPDKLNKLARLLKVRTNDLLIPRGANKRTA